MLKYTYVYGYYLKSMKAQNLFEFIQQDLEKNTEFLHELIEKPLDPFLNEEVNRSPFYQYKGELVNYF